MRELEEHPLAGELAASGGYRFVRSLAQGGMGEVAEVEYVALGERRVMKLLRKELTGNAELADRLRSEARIVTKVKHPNVVQVLDYGVTAKGRPYLVTELLVGQSLKDWLADNGVMSEAEALEVARQTLLGLERVHGEGIVHRDLKPDNLFYATTPEGKIVKILDFGISKITAAADRKALGHHRSTAEGMLLGSPAFLSPEQARGRKIDPRTDLYGLGTTLFRLTTGRMVFVEPNGVELLKAHAMKPPPPPSTVAPQKLSAAFDVLVLRSLAKNPEERFESARAMRAAIEALQRGVTATPSVSTPTPREQQPSTPEAPLRVPNRGTVRMVDPRIPLPPGADQDSAHGTVHLPEMLPDFGPRPAAEEAADTEPQAQAWQLEVEAPPTRPRAATHAPPPARLRSGPPPVLMLAVAALAGVLLALLLYWSRR